MLTFQRFLFCILHDLMILLCAPHHKKMVLEIHMEGWEHGYGDAAGGERQRLEEAWERGFESGKLCAGKGKSLDT